MCKIHNCTHSELILSLFARFYYIVILRTSNSFPIRFVSIWTIAIRFVSIWHHYNPKSFQSPDSFQFWNINLPSILLLLCNSVWFAHRRKEEWLAKCVESILIKMLWSLGRIKYSWWLMIFLFQIELSRLQCFYSLILQAPDQTNRLKSNTWIDLTMVGVVELHVIQNTISNRYENHIRLFK